MTLTVEAPHGDGGVVLSTVRDSERLENVSGRDPPKEKKNRLACLRWGGEGLWGEGVSGGVAATKLNQCS